MIKVYTDFNCLTADHRKAVFPLLLFLHYLKDASLLKCYELVSKIENADLMIVPLEVSYLITIKGDNYFKNFIKLGKEHNLEIWAYTGGDFGITLPNYITNFRLGGFESKLHQNCQILPAYSIDPYIYLKAKVSYLDKPKVPTIGFVGHAKGGCIKFMKEFILHIKREVNNRRANVKLDSQRFFPSSVIRYKLLKKLENSKLVSSNFIYRKNYRAGIMIKSERGPSQNEFYNNIKENLYTYCMRGGGNFSVRFYETLALGRIPLLINTDCRLPLNEFIDWKKHCIIATKKNYTEKLIEFHNNHSDEELKKIQKANRDLWENSLVLNRYFIHMHNLKVKK